MSFLNINEICRICLRKRDEMKVLRETEIENILSFISIQILEEEKTHFICIDCVNKMQNWFEFYQQIIQSFKIGHLIMKSLEKKEANEIISFSNNTSIELCFLGNTTVHENITEVAVGNINITEIEKYSDEENKCTTLNEDVNIDGQFQQIHEKKLGDVETSQIALTKSNNHECEKCGKIFKQFQTLNDHMKRHYNLRNFACSLCDKSFYKQFNVLEHMRIHTGERPFKCESCSRTFTRALRLRNHNKKVHSNDTKFVCEFCRKSFVDNYQLKIHMRTHTGEKPYKCLECDKAFALQGQLNSHIKYKHTQQKDFICNICARAFTAKHSLEAHLQVHFGKKREPKHECSLCGKKCITTTQLKIHIKSQHTGERPFPCQLCEKGFVTSTALESHIRTHTGEKSYFCGECGKGFGTNSTLKIHSRVHSGERPFKCEHCCKTFSQGSTLNTHLKTHKLSSDSTIRNVNQ